MGKKVSDKKIFVLDSSVVLHDHQSVTSFDEHDVAIPITVLEEVDNFKKGSLNINFQAREFVRFIDALSEEGTLNDWRLLGPKKNGHIKVIMHGETGGKDAEKIFGDRKNDHKILNAALSLAYEFPKRQVILVSKDINLRIKAKSLDLLAEDYQTGKVENIDTLYKGYELKEGVDSELISGLYKKDGAIPFNKIFKEKPLPNQYFILKSERSSALSFYNDETQNLELVGKTSCYGIEPRNAEQSFAMHAVMKNDVRLVTIQGVAGTGKTLLALAGAIENRKSYHQIYLARPIVPLSNKDIGYLPGDIKSKINPYMEPLWDNLKFIQSQFKESDPKYKQIQDMVDNEKLVITPLAYIRGRSLSNIIFIIDEAQNLTPHEIKTIITRAGENTKIIFTGDIRQIDTPYLDSSSNGLSYLIDRLHGQPLYAHVNLEKGERSELANLANELL
jgi:PhoH-like ATPase